MNSIKFIGIITTLGSVGKLLFCLIFILGVILFVDREKIKIKFLSKKEWIIMISFLLLFTASFTLITNTRINLLPNLAFPVYFIFYYFLIKLLIRVYQAKFGIKITKVVQFKVLDIFRKTLFANFLLWFALAIVSGVNMYETDGGFGGFFQDEIHFGFYVVTGFLVSFYFRYNTISKDTSYFNLLLILMYGGVATLTSRNAFLIIVVALIFYFGISNIKNRFYRVSLSTLMIIGVIVGLIIQDFSEEDVIILTSGRYQIWTLAFEEMFTKNFMLLGNGLFNLNDVILRENRGIGFYYLDTLENLSFHSSYIEILSGGGIVVLICFFMVISKTWKKLEPIEKSILIGILVGATFESFLVQPFMLIASLFYVIIISNNMEVKNFVKSTLESDLQHHDKSMLKSY
ncbi:O-antigen ligase family protein [Aquimarina pacifica]|uniref:O-antigen ligase family protein n=1 Tax=Aquimarina pacifica TaxID=1296415 RepID=UPI0012688F18|nr:O-antigen ligase family protein [Aquimarina pacifica]